MCILEKRAAKADSRGAHLPGAGLSVSVMAGGPDRALGSHLTLQPARPKARAEGALTGFGAPSREQLSVSQAVLNAHVL